MLQVRQSASPAADPALDTIDENKAAARGANKLLIADVSVFDIYSGEGIDTGKKSIAFSVRLQPVEKTMTDAEIDAVAAAIVAAVATGTGGTLRG